MFDKLCCLLCLESIDDPSKHIDLDSTVGHALKAQEIIEKHFTNELNIMSQISMRIVCQECWQLVHTFHNFYQRVQKAHTAATEALKSLSELQLDTKVIKLEVDMSSETDPPLPRRRGRPRKCRKPPMEELQDEQIIFAPKCDIQIEELTLPSFQTDTKLESQEEETQIFEIKHEALQEDSLGAPYLQNDTDITSLDSFPRDNYVSNKNVSKKKRHAKRKQKIGKPQKRQVNLAKTYERSQKITEADEYIARKFPLACCLCKIPLANFKELKHHFRIAHQTRGYVLCCGKKLPKRGVLVDHIHVHEDPDYFKCETCGKVMTDRRGLELHHQYFHGSRERIFQCDICSKGFFRRSVLSRHYLSHAPEEQKTFTCTECEKTFPSEYVMRQHKKLVHLNLYAKICDICGKSIRGRDALLRHQQEHAGIPRTLFKCSLCDAELTTKYGLARHMKTMHTEEFQTPQVCPFCSKISPTLQAHQNHVKYMHKIGRRHECKMCDKAFKRPTDLREHMTTHTGEVLYTCTFCPKTFNSNANMYAHRKRKHPKEWAENCNNKNNAKKSLANTAQATLLPPPINRENFE